MENQLQYLQIVVTTMGHSSMQTSQGQEKGIPKFEMRLVELEIKHILARVRHPQTNGKLERVFGEVQRKLPRFAAIMQRTSDPVDLFMKWYNYDRPHMSLKDGRERPADAFVRKQHPKETIIDEESGDEHDVK